MMYCIHCGAPLEEIPGENGRRRCTVCGRIRYQNPAPCVSVLLLSQDKVLLGLRGKTSIMPGKWCLPCGHIEGGESFLTAAKREVREETGLEIEPRSIVNVTANHFLPEIHSLVVVLTAVPAGGFLRPGDDITAVDWFPVQGPFPDMAFQADLHIIEQYRRRGPAWGIPLDQTVIDFFEDRYDDAPICPPGRDLPL